MVYVDAGGDEVALQLAEAVPAKKTDSTPNVEPRSGGTGTLVSSSRTSFTECYQDILYTSGSGPLSQRSTAVDRWLSGSSSRTRLRQ